MEISKAKRLGYSLWVIPLAVSAFFALIELLAAPPFDPNGWYAGNNGVSCFINVLCPLGYALAWATTKSREDRLTFLTFLAIHFLLVSLTMLLSVMRLDGVPQMILEWLFLAEAFGAFVMALLRRKAVVVRAALWREPEQREARVRKRAMRAEERREAKLRQEEALIEDERQKMAEQTRGRRNGRRTKPEVSTRALDVEASATTSRAASGSALEAVLGATAVSPVQSAETLQDDGTSQPSTAEAGRTSAVRVDMDPSIETGSVPVTAAATSAPTAHVQSESSPSSTVDVNTCSPTELLALSGMTVAIARAMVDEREAHGPYRSVEDVVARNGLKPHVVASFITRLSVSEAPAQTRQEGRRGRVLDL